MACDLPVALNLGEVEEIRQVMTGLAQISRNHGVTFKYVHFALSGDTGTVDLEDIGEGQVGVCAVG